MTETAAPGEKRPAQWKTLLKKGVRVPGRWLRDALASAVRAGVRWRNWRLRRTRLDYVVVRLAGSFPERAAPPRSFIERRLPLPPTPLSMQGYNGMVQRLVDADNVRGVVIILDGVAVSLARMQSLRQGIERLREAGKRVVIYTQTLGNGHYYLATAADQIVIPPPANWDVFGLYQEVVFLRDALAFVGVKIDNLQISPYKSAMNPLSEQEMTPQQQEQLDWLLDDQYEQLTSGMAAGRGKRVEEIRQLIDQAPLTAGQALEAGLVDAVAYEDQLAELLAFPNETKTINEEKSSPPAGLEPWAQAVKKLRRRYRSPYRGEKIAVVSLEGLIIRGSSQTPPIDLPIPFIGGQMAGDRTIIQLLRQVEMDDEVGALIFYVDSRGGDALASDVIGREIERLHHKLPIVVYMGDVAASGGYYVSAFAREIFCQPGTITGSIGVVMARPNTDELYEKLHLNRVSLQRGARADLMTDRGELKPEQRAVLERGIDHAYEQFKDVVARGRGLPVEQLDPISQGRVWTGRQALGHHLVDQEGSFLQALARAKELAGLPSLDEAAVRVENIYPEKGERLLPRPFTEPVAYELLPWVVDRLNFLTGTLYLLPLDLTARGGRKVDG